MSRFYVLTLLILGTCLYLFLSRGEEPMEVIRETQQPEVVVRMEDPSESAAGGALISIVGKETDEANEEGNMEKRYEQKLVKQAKRVKKNRERVTEIIEKMQREFGNDWIETLSVEQQVEYEIAQKAYMDSRDQLRALKN